MEFPKETALVALNSIVETLKDPREKIIFSVLSETSCKISELANIKASDISQNKIKIKNRVVQISEKLSSLLSNFLSNNKISQDEYLLSTRQSKKISTKRIRQIIQSASKINPEQIRKISIKEKLKNKPLSEVKREVGLKRLDKRKYLSKEQIQTLRNAIKDKRDSMLFELLLSGIKSNELIELKVQDAILLNLPVALSEKIESYISKNKTELGEYLFQTRQGTHLTKERIFQIIVSLGKTAGIEVSPRTLNNTALAAAIATNNQTKLRALKIKNQAFHLHGGFYKNE